MKNFRKNLTALLLVFCVLLCAVSAGCTLKKDSENSGMLKSDSLKLSSFTPLGKDIVKTLFEKIPGSEDKTTVTGAYDLDGDGKDESVSLTFVSCLNDGKSVLNINGSKITTDSFFAISGVYVVDLDHNDKTKELAVCDYQMDDDIYTFFYRYDGTLKSIGKIYGGLSEDLGENYTTLSVYNYAIQTNKEGLLIPRLGIMEYTETPIVIAVSRFEDGAFKELSLDMSGVYKKSYTLSKDIKPYFEEMASAPTGFSPQFNDSDIITLKKGATIRFQKISNSLGDSYSSFVTLSDGKTGMLYFFVHP